MKKKVLVSGATGFVGTQIVKELSKYDLDIQVVVRQSNKSFKILKNNKKITKIFLTKDLFKEDLDWYIKILRNIDLVIHAAWYVNPNDYNTSLKNYICFNGTKKLVLACKKNKIKKFVGLGTCFEYDLNFRYLSVHTPLKPLSIYAKNKVKTFNYCYNFFVKSKIDFLWCRLFYLFGIGEPKEKLFSLLKSKLKKKEKIILGNKNIVRDYLNIKKAAKIIVENSLGNTNGVFNVCSGKGVTLKEIADKMIRKYGGKNLVKFDKNLKDRAKSQFIVGLKNTIREA
jgi:dTDP-6-deoxy-L-talose 4-dehydrogenase (NAD+)